MRKLIIDNPQGQSLTFQVIYSVFSNSSKLILDLKTTFRDFTFTIRNSLGMKVNSCIYKYST